MVTTFMFRHILQCAALALLLIFYSTKAAATDNPIIVEALPKEILGAWVVNSAHINIEIGSLRSYAFNDPELMGRRFRLSKNDISTNALGATRCLNPQIVKWPSEADLFIGISMGRKGYYPGIPAQAKDFELPLQGDALIEALILRCSTGYVGPRASYDLPSPLNTKEFDTWMILLNHDQMAMKWYDDTILLLRREVKKPPRH